MNNEENGITMGIMAIIIVALSVGIVIMSGYAYLLKAENDRFNLVIEEIRTQVLPETVSSTPSVPIEKPYVAKEISVDKVAAPQTDGQMFYLELFDYRKLILRSIDFLTRGEAFSYVSVNESTAFKLCISSGEGNYLVTQLEDGYY